MSVDLDRFIRQWAETQLSQVERELITSPTSRALLALEVNDVLRAGVNRLRRFPSLSGKEIFSYRAADIWKYQFAAPLLITEDAAKLLYQGYHGREKAVNVIEGFPGSRQMVLIHGEHILPTESQRDQLPHLLKMMEDSGTLDIARFPNTSHALVLLTMNKIVCMHPLETLRQSKQTKGGGWARLPIGKTAVVARRWFQKKDGEGFYGEPRDLGNIGKRIRDQFQPSTFEEFWNLLVEK